MLSHRTVFAVLALSGSLLATPGLFAQGIDKHADFAKVQATFTQYCGKCHGEKNAKPKSAPFQVANLEHIKKMTAVDGGKTKLWEMLTNKPDEGGMPPEGEDRIPAAELAVVEKWIKDSTAGALPTETKVSIGEATPELKVLANDVKGFFRKHCFECHGDTKTEAGIKMLDYDFLTKSGKIKPGKIKDSAVFRAMSAKGDAVMPPPDKPRPALEDVLKVVDWVNAGAPAWDGDVKTVGNEADEFFKQNNVMGVGHVLTAIRDDVRKLRVEDRPYVRYFSINHLVIAGTTNEDLVRYRKALALAVNHLTWERQLVQLRPVDATVAAPDPKLNGPPKPAPEPTVFAVDLRKLGWDKYYYEADYYDARTGQYKGLPNYSFNLWDMMMLEYPYGVAYYNSRLYDDVYQDYLRYANQVRPIPYVRGDWFCSICTQHPVYEDMLQIPMELYDPKTGLGLETRLGVKAEHNINTGVAIRAGMLNSGVSRNNRIVERHPARFGHYWKSIDFASSKGGENMFRNPITPEFSGGEMIFNLPNGMQGYLVTDTEGNRINEAPTSIVKDKFASDGIVRNGLACMRCHNEGVKVFKDDVRPAVKLMLGQAFEFDQRFAMRLYPPHKKGENDEDGDDRYMEDYVNADKKIFADAYQKLLGEGPKEESPLTPVSKQYLDTAMNLHQVSAELGFRDPAKLRTIFTTPQFVSIGVLPLGTGGQLKRDAWEEYYDQVVTGLGLGDAIMNLDGLTRTSYQTDWSTNVKLVATDAKTNAPKKTWASGDKFFVNIKNEGKHDVYVEMIGTDTKGLCAIVVPCTTVIKAGKSMKWPSGEPLSVDNIKGREAVTLYACKTAFPPGVRLRMKNSERLDSKWMFDRVVHNFYGLRRVGNKVGIYYENQPFRPERMVKKTLTLETQ